MLQRKEEIHLGRYLSRRLFPLAIGIGLLISVLFPVTYFILEYNNMSHTASFYATRFSRSMHDLVMQSEMLWKYQTYDYRKILDLLPLEKEINLQVLDDAGKPVSGYEHINPKGIGWWDELAPTASAPIRFNSRLIGTVKVTLSQEMLLTRTLLIFVTSLFVGTALAALSYFFPVRIVTKMGDKIESLINSLQNAETESRCLQLEAQQSEQRFRELVQGLDAIVWEANSLDWRFSFVSRQAEEILGYPLERWFNEPDFWLKHLHPADRDRIVGLYSSGFSSGSAFHLEHRFQAADGRTIWIRNLISIATDDSFHTNKIRGVIVDITQHKLADESLAAEKERLAVTLRSIGDGVITTDMDGKIVLINSVAERLTGWKQEKAVGRPLNEVFSIIDDKSRTSRENSLESVVRAGSIISFFDNTILVAKDGTERIIEDSAAPIFNSESKIIGVVLAFRDMTEKKKMAQDFMKTQQLESLGILAGGIAHDFNNLLTGILGKVSLARIYLEPESKAFKKLEEAEKAYERARDLTQSLLTFSRGDAPKKRTLSIGQLIMNTASFTLSGSNVKCDFSIPDDIWPTDVDEGQISQVLSNLVINADQAMQDGGMINIRLENVTASKGEIAPLKDGRYVRITLEDHGAGIPESNLQKIFDPYFTTKPGGHGLGLATVHSIIRHHDGYISVKSKPGVGTTFCIYLPASENKPDACSDERHTVVRGKEKILVMDDEEIIREVTSEILDNLGYRVAVCCDGEEAIELYNQAVQAVDPFDVVIMDLTIPGGMGGEQAIKKLQQINPEVKAIVSSGYSNDPIIANYSNYGFSGCVVKPYRGEELNEALCAVLHSPDRSNGSSLLH